MDQGSGAGADFPSEYVMQKQSPDSLPAITRRPLTLRPLGRFVAHFCSLCHIAAAVTVPLLHALLSLFLVSDRGSGEISFFGVKQIHLWIHERWTPCQGTERLFFSPESDDVCGPGF